MSSDYKQTRNPMIDDIKNSLEFDRDRVGMPGCAIRMRAVRLLRLIEVAQCLALFVDNAGDLVNGFRTRELLEEITRLVDDSE